MPQNQAQKNLFHGEHGVFEENRCLYECAFVVLQIIPEIIHLVDIYAVVGEADGDAIITDHDIDDFRRECSRRV